MILEHQGKRPRIDGSAWVAPNATICGDVTIGPESRILFGAVITAESGPVEIGTRCIVMENAVVRGVSRHPVTIGDHVLVGPHAHLSGCTVARDVFIATGACIFNGATIGERTTVRIRGIVHVRTRLPPDSVVPIGWVALGDPVQLFSPKDHDQISALLAELDFAGTVFGDRAAPRGETRMPERSRRYTRALRSYEDDRIVEP
jgi:carbonic anhydrase/acetyltransferase-like protein (isoleucine patch superfamily)